MKKLLYAFLALLFASSLSAQVYLDTWKVGFGLSYPRLVNTGLSAEIVNVGGYGSLQYNVSEHTTFRGKLAANYFMNKSVVVGGVTYEPSTLAFGGDVDLLYSFTPCEVASPYLLVGVGGQLFSTSEAVSGDEDMAFDFELNYGLGVYWNLDEDWALNAEVGLHVLPTEGFDGDIRTNPGSSFFGGPWDSYVNMSLGLLYAFDKGEKSKLCELYTGVVADAKIDYDKIENIVKKYIPKEVVKEVVVEKQVAADHTEKAPAAYSNNNWVLVGVNFDFNSSKLTPESYPILFHALQVLLQNPDMEVEIQGHTDNIGSEKYNLKVSKDRAEKVKGYLVAKGVDASRLKVVGYGETMPMADNKTAAGRAINRRIEFKVMK